MNENDVSTPSLPEKPKNGRFAKGQSGNPKGRGKGKLAKRTKFLQIMSPHTQRRAINVLNQILRQAEEGHVDSQKMVVEVLKPFIKREVEKDGGGAKQPLITINVGITEGKKPTVIAARVIDGKTGQVEA